MQSKSRLTREGILYYVRQGYAPGPLVVKHGLLGAGNDPVAGSKILATRSRLLWEGRR